MLFPLEGSVIPSFHRLRWVLLSRPLTAGVLHIRTQAPPPPPHILLLTLSLSFSHLKLKFQSSASVAGKFSPKGSAFSKYWP